MNQSIKTSGAHEHQGEIEDDRFNIEPYSTTKSDYWSPKNNAWCEKEALLWKDGKKIPKNRG